MPQKKTQNWGQKWRKGYDNPMLISNKGKMNRYSQREEKQQLDSNIQGNVRCHMGLSPPFEARNSFHFVIENSSSRTQPENYREHTSCQVDRNFKDSLLQ